MAKTWFAADFCPHDAKCSLEDGALIPTNGPKIRTLELTEPRDRPFASTVQAFADERSFYDAQTNPNDWAKCEGQLLPIAQNTVLFSLLGTMYGGDGRVTFGLPDLRNEGQGDYYIYLIDIMR